MNLVLVFLMQNDEQDHLNSLAGFTDNNSHKYEMTVLKEFQFRKDSNFIRPLECSKSSWYMI